MRIDRRMEGLRAHAEGQLSGSGGRVRGVCGGATDCVDVVGCQVQVRMREERGPGIGGPSGIPRRRCARRGGGGRSRRRRRGGGGVGSGRSGRRRRMSWLLAGAASTDNRGSLRSGGRSGGCSGKKSALVELVCDRGVHNGADGRSDEGRSALLEVHVFGDASEHGCLVRSLLQGDGVGDVGAVGAEAKHVGSGVFRIGGKSARHKGGRRDIGGEEEFEDRVDGGEVDGRGGRGGGCDGGGVWLADRGLFDIEEGFNLQREFVELFLTSVDEDGERGGFEGSKGFGGAGGERGGGILAEREVDLGVEALRYRSSGFVRFQLCEHAEQCGVMLQERAQTGSGL